MSEQRATPEEIARVRRWECEQEGHDFEILQTVQSRDPQRIICGRCGKSWSIGPSSKNARRQITALEGIRGALEEAEPAFRKLQPGVLRGVCYWSLGKAREGLGDAA